ncbi:excinuclease ABC subunit UvrA [Corynebacterium variabile]|uniref:excinuclease ABC subunit UvrA n=1 Tax=Corynebacterium variabile TaxID=1727 RepID=UPI001DBC2BF2|nr:excinuclease ABC subunit UvrA [Corynebacterium variabile]HJG46237.1 excinuclease ABC subunit UvrA [Corynebacterium variabile]
MITVTGARTHNLRDIDVEIPSHALTVVTGVSGSGKSSLVFDTIAAEAQRATAAGYPSFVRTRLAQHPPADVNRIDGLTFTTVVDQRRFTGNARSTVATAVDLSTPLRMLFSRFAVPSAGFSPAYSPNDPAGMCLTCEGLGTVSVIDEDALIDPDLSLNDGAVRFPTFAPGTYRWKRLVTSGLCDPSVPWSQLPEDVRDVLMHARDLALKDPLPGYPDHGRFDGIIPRLQDSYLRRTPSRLTTAERAGLDAVVSHSTCPDCAGARLNTAARSSLINGRSIADWATVSVSDLYELVVEATETLGESAAPLLTEISRRVDALVEVGLGYLNLDRSSPTLSGGEAQRVKMVRHLGSPLTEVTYVFDEPAAGLHPSDVQRLITLLTGLRDRRNTVLVVDHNPAVIATADHVIGMGPGAGESGGRITFTGTPASVSSADAPVIKPSVRTPTGSVTVEHARSNNLRDLTVTVPTGVLTVVTGVAGSGKSSLMTTDFSAQHPDFTVVGQQPLHGGRRSSLLTVTGVADGLRSLFAASGDLSASWFSRNAKGGCPECRGAGEITTDLAFMEDTRTPCEACGGSGFNDKALSVTVGGYTIAEVEALRSADVAGLLGPADAARLRWVDRVGLGYLAIGRTLDGLSGGERQRLLLARHLGSVNDDEPRRLILDEPTTGLHAADVRRLLELFDELVDAGGTLVLIEHNQQVMAHADHVIDIGPGAGDAGGQVVFEGTPAALAHAGARSVTGRCLADALRGD